MPPLSTLELTHKHAHAMPLLRDLASAQRRPSAESGGMATAVHKEPPNELRNRATLGIPAAYLGEASASSADSSERRSYNLRRGRLSRVSMA